jgi:hypothetical protein
MKVFDCQKMSKELRKEFFDYYRCYSKGNDTFVKFYLGDDYDEVGHRIEKWLLDNGAEDGDEVLIEHWW